LVTDGIFIQKNQLDLIQNTFQSFNMKPLSGDLWGQAIGLQDGQKTLGIAGSPKDFLIFKSSRFLDQPLFITPGPRHNIILISLRLINQALSIRQSPHHLLKGISNLFGRVGYLEANVSDQDTRPVIF
jgi:hypothetical protein